MRRVTRILSLWDKVCKRDNLPRAYPRLVLSCQAWTVLAQCKQLCCSWSKQKHEAMS